MNITKLLLIIGLISASLTEDARALNADLNFRVWIDQREVGTHQVQLTSQASKTEAVTRVDMKLKILLITVFDYKHESREIWDENCLVQLDTRTTVNRKKYSVKASSQATPGSPATKMVIESTSPDASSSSQPNNDCVASFAYWDLEKLQNRNLINTQTGEITPTAFKAQGESIVPKTKLAANTYRLSNAEANITLWYSDENDWLALQTETRRGQLTYVRKDLL